LPDTSSPDNSSTVNPCDIKYDYADKDLVKLSDDQVKFGDGNWVPGIGTVLGSGHVQWSVVCGYYTPELIGVIHLNNASGKYARMHISYWDAAGRHIDTRYSPTVHAANDDHHSWPVDLLPLNQAQIVEAHVCTEISDGGDNFHQPACKTVYFN
jgi:hypothetical protein